MKKIMKAIILFSFVFACFAMRADAATRTALVIGNGGYKTSALRNPVNDATDMAAALKERGFNVTFKINANQKTMERAIRKFGKSLRNGGVGLFYYAGHGLQVKGNNYLIPIGSIIESEADVKYEAVDAGLVLGKMEDAGNDLNIVILDACRNNPFARSFRSSISGLARMDAPKGSFIAYATAPGSLAADGEGRNGIYTKHLIRNINKPHINVEKVFKNVRVAVVSETSSKQVPWEASSLMGTFYFDPEQTGEKRNKNSVKEKPLPKNSYELLFWESIKDSEEVESFNAYLKKFPNGVFEDLAKLKIKQMSNTSSEKNSADKKKNIVKETTDSKHIKKKVKILDSSVESENQQLKKVDATNQHVKNDGRVQIKYLPFNFKGRAVAYASHRLHLFLALKDNSYFQLINEPQREIVETHYIKQSFFSEPTFHEEFINSNLSGLFLTGALNVVQNGTDRLYLFLFDTKMKKMVSVKGSTESWNRDGYEKTIEMMKKLMKEYKNVLSLPKDNPANATTVGQLPPPYSSTVLVKKKDQEQSIKLSSISLADKEPAIIAKEGQYSKYKNGIVYDKKNGLEWVVGPDKNMGGYAAKKWVKNFNLDGDGWRMPSTSELKGLYKSGAGSRNMTPLLDTSGSFVWSSVAGGFSFFSGDNNYGSANYRGCRAFAVRSRK
ncbi:MAG: hypothetical protein HN417_04935 [Desulfobacula sp.]|nr:hypothetical protein [Desulfobacula sp.]